MKYERMKNNGVGENADNPVREQYRKIGDALFFAFEAARREYLLVFKKEVLKRMEAKDLPEMFMRVQIDKCSRKLQRAIKGVEDEVLKELNKR